VLNLRVGRTFSFGSTRRGGGTAPSSGGGGPRGVPTEPLSTGSGSQGIAPGSRPLHALDIRGSPHSESQQRRTNHIIGIIASPLFGQGNQPYGVGVLAGTGFQNQRTVAGWNCRRGLLFKAFSKYWQQEQA
jgi:hypothetical protein